MKENLVLESISFDELRPTNNIDKESFRIHLKEIFKDLSQSGKKDNKGIYFNRFSDLIPQCPVFIAYKFFKSLFKSDYKKKAYLSLKEFLEGITTLKFGTYEEVGRLIFNIFDFDKKGSANPEDIKQLLSFLPLKENNQKPTYLYQMDSLSELDQILSDSFGNANNIKFNEFINIIDQKANIFLMVFCYLYNIMPVLDKDLVLILNKNSGNSSESSSTPRSVQSNFSSNSGQKLLISPSIFSPVSVFRSKQRKMSQCEKEIKENILDKLSINPSLFKKVKIKEPDTPITKSLKTIGVTPIELKSSVTEVLGSSLNSTNYKSTAQANTQKSDNSNIDELKTLIQKSTIIECSKETSNIDIFTKMSDRELENEVEIIDTTDFDAVSGKELKEYIIYEGELFKFVKVNGKLCLNYFYLTLIGQSIYYYKDINQKKQDYLESTFLPGCFFRENEKEEIGANYFHSFSIILPNENKRFYNKDQEEIKTWIKHLREVLCYEDFFDFYRIGETIGNGEFGVIKAGFDKKSNEKVGIKILNKAKITKLEQLNLMRSEIAIMKHSKHPNIIRFIANYENSEYIFIVMEFLKTGTLQKFLENRKININEKMAANISYQISDALLYLKKYGIIHRDLKPENILIKIIKEDPEDKNLDIIEIKIMDFGLSKILGNSETTNEGYGTIAFISPEILQRLPYNYKVDIWSLGVIIYFLLSGEIPFMPKSSKLEEMILYICNKDPTFSKKFDKISKDAIDLIKVCLEKKPGDRISIEEVVNHKWFKNINLV